MAAQQPRPFITVADVAAAPPSAVIGTIRPEDLARMHALPYRPAPPVRLFVSRAIPPAPPPRSA